MPDSQQMLDSFLVRSAVGSQKGSAGPICEMRARCSAILGNPKNLQKRSKTRWGAPTASLLRRLSEMSGPHADRTFKVLQLMLTERTCLPRPASRACYCRIDRCRALGRRQDAVDRRATNPELAGDLGRPHAIRRQFPHLISLGHGGGLAAFVLTLSLRLSDPSRCSQPPTSMYQSLGAQTRLSCTILSAGSSRATVHRQDP